MHDLYQTELVNLSNDTIVVAHEAFGYLCEEYGLKQEGIEGLTADSEPDSARLKEVIDFCKKHDIKIIFFEELVSPKVAEVVALSVIFYLFLISYNTPKHNKYYYIYYSIFHPKTQINTLNI